MPKQSPSVVTRREFVKTATAAAAAMTGACAQPAAKVAVMAPGAAPDKPIRVGLIGAGGRGYGAIHDAIMADPKVKIVAMADIFPDRLKEKRERLLKNRQQEVEEKYCFLGFDAYKKVLELDLDYVCLATPPYYRPEHFAACIDAGKHVFTEKPVAVDPVGIRKFMEAGKKAAEKKLCVVAGTQRRHQKPYVETVKRLRDGAIGEIRAAQCYWNGGQLWFRKREKDWSDMDWMHRDWVNWCWLSGDHIVEQHVHNIDVINWVLGKHPEKVVAMGARARRVTGDQYDFFSADFTYPGEVHVLSQCRQVNDCWSSVSERVIGQNGYSDCHSMISTIKDYKVDGGRNPYEQEHVDLIAAIRSGNTINEAQNVAESTLCAIMARMSAYTGKEVTWDEVMKSDLTLSKPDYPISEEAGRAHLPVPGKA